MSRRPFERLVDEHGPMVLRVCRAVVGPADAEDAWSETFLSALKAYPQLPGDANVEAWLVTIAHRKAIDLHRARGRRPVPVDALPEEPSRTGRPEDWDGDLWHALGELPDRQRRAVAYHYLAGFPYRDVAAITGGTADAARRAAADGIKALRLKGLGVTGPDRAGSDGAGSGSAGSCSAGSDGTGSGSTGSGGGRRAANEGARA
ncbi:sigma-70 family RNA polymerase sigma factor [Amycolatopsis sp. PS_44_ISF1]|nr:sigma-70 family RNA polymerase sigma factor [Amycolatopsis sp. PS_44_ISF1]